jgi:hypothetical protein
MNFPNALLDENIVILACKLESDRGAADTTCLDLIRTILENCHALIVSGPIWDKYCSQLKALESQAIQLTPGIMRILSALLSDLRKASEFLADHELVHVPEIIGLGGVDEGDILFVRAAASVHGSILVTSDGPLIRALRTHRIDRSYGFALLSPPEALNLCSRADS